MHRYSITNRRTEETMIIRAGSAQEACEALGWLISYCYCQRLD